MLRSKYGRTRQRRPAWQGELLFSVLLTDLTFLSASSCTRESVYNLLVSHVDRGLTPASARRLARFSQCRQESVHQRLRRRARQEALRGPVCWLSWSVRGRR